MAFLIDDTAIMIAREFVEDNKFNPDSVLSIEEECFKIGDRANYDFQERTISKYAIAYCNYFRGTR